MNDENQTKVANKLYEELTNAGVELIFDDRDERPGVKFKDMDLIGVPIKVTVGKKINDNLVEFKLRNESNFTDVSVDEIINKIKEYIKDNLK